MHRHIYIYMYILTDHVDGDPPWQLVQSRKSSSWQLTQFPLGHMHSPELRYKYIHIYIYIRMCAYSLRFSYRCSIYLIGGLEHLFIFSIWLGIVTPTDELIFFRGVGIPPTRCSIYRLPEMLWQSEHLTSGGWLRNPAPPNGFIKTQTK